MQLLKPTRKPSFSFAPAEPVFLGFAESSRRTAARGFFYSMLFETAAAALALAAWKLFSR